MAVWMRNPPTRDRGKLCDKNLKDRYYEIAYVAVRPEGQLKNIGQSQYEKGRKTDSYGPPPGITMGDK